MSDKPKTEKKVVNVKAHIASARGKGIPEKPSAKPVEAATSKRSAGRPRGTGKGNTKPTKNDVGTMASAPANTGNPIPVSTLPAGNNTAPSGNLVTTVQAPEDTTEEAKGFISGIFEMPAGILGIKELALTETELLSIAPSFKVVYDKRIKPHLGEYGDVMILALVAGGIIAKKLNLAREVLANRALQNKMGKMQVTDIPQPAVPIAVQAPAPVQNKAPTIIATETRLPFSMGNPSAIPAVAVM